MHHFCLPDLSKINKFDNTLSVGKSVGTQGFLYLAGGTIQWYNFCGELYNKICQNYTYKTLTQQFHFQIFPSGIITQKYKYTSTRCSRSILVIENNWKHIK